MTVSIISHQRQTKWRALFDELLSPPDYGLQIFCDCERRDVLPALENIKRGVLAWCLSAVTKKRNLVCLMCVRGGKTRELSRTVVELFRQKQSSGTPTSAPTILHYGFLFLFLAMVFMSTTVHAQMWSVGASITPGTITNPSADIIIGVDTQPFYLTTTAASDTDMLWQMGNPPTYPADSFNNTGAYTWDTQGVGTLSSPYGTSVLWTPPTTAAKFTLKCTYNDDAPAVQPPATGTRNDDPVYATRSVTVVQANVFTDTNYDGFMMGSGDDPGEENTPGRLVAYNEDGAAQNYHPHWVNDNYAPEDKNLVMMGLKHWPETGVNGCKLKLEIGSGSGSIRLWKRGAPTGSCDGQLVSPATWVIGTDTIPNPLFIEGVSPGYVTIYCVFLRPDNSEAHRDALLVQVVDVFNISSSTVNIKKGIGLDNANEVHPAGIATSLNVSHIPVENLQYRMTVPQPPSGFSYSLFNPSTGAIIVNDPLAFLNPSNEQVFTGTFAVSSTFPTGTTDVPVRVYAGTVDGSGNVNQGFIAERKLHAVVSNVAVHAGNNDSTLTKADKGPFHRVKIYSSTNHINGMDCTIYLPETDPSTCNIVNDLLSKDSAYAYIRGTAGTCNIEVGLQLGHSNNPGWKPYALVNGDNRLLLTDDPYAPVSYGPGNVEVSYRTTGNILQSVPSHKILLWLDGHEWYITEDTWNGSNYKGLTRVTSIAQDFDDNNMCINGPLDGDYPTRHSGLFTSGSFITGVSWTDNLLYVDNNYGITWTRSNFPDTAVGNYPYTPYVNASGENDWPDDTVSSIYTMRQ